MKSRVCLSFDPELLHRIDAAADAIAATRSFTVATLCRRGLDALAGEGAAEVSAPPPLPGAALIIEINLDAPTPHVAIAETIQEAAALARERGLRWAGCGGPREIAALTPPVEASSAVCATVALASALAVSSNWHRCPPQLVRQGIAA
jgi:hypothetical protein